MSTQYRVTCREYSQPVATLAKAEAWVTHVETQGACLYLHTIEVEVDGEWVPLHVHRARQILAAPLNQAIETPDGPLTKSHGTWSAEASQRADAAGEVASDEWWAALGPHSEATLTGDGRGVVTTGWCTDNPSADTWVRYERYSDRGREAHGFVCPDCRRLVQTG